MERPAVSVYQAGKSAVIGVTKEMACDFGPDNIRANAICPGHIVTERSAEYWHGRDGVQPLILEQSPLRRVGKTDDIAAATAFLCSDEASFVTGHALVVGRRAVDSATGRPWNSPGQVRPIAA